MFSAIKIAGERAYDLARDGAEVRDRGARDRRSSARPCRLRALTRATFEAECGKGAYVRSLARDMGRVLGCHCDMFVFCCGARGSGRSTAERCGARRRARRIRKRSGPGAAAVSTPASSELTRGGGRPQWRGDLCAVARSFCCGDPPRRRKGRPTRSASACLSRSAKSKAAFSSPGRVFNLKG